MLQFPGSISWKFAWCAWVFDGGIAKCIGPIYLQKIAVLLYDIARETAEE